MNTREKIARIVAAKYSNNLKKAVEEYKRLLLRQQVAVDGDFEAIKTEIFNLLPPYRYPTFDEIGEAMIFWGPDLEGLKSTAYQQPDIWYQLKDFDIDKTLMSDLETYIKESESKKLTLVDKEERLNDIESKVHRAEKAYKDPSIQRTEQKHAKAAKEMGFPTGKASTRIDHKAAYREYVTLVRSKAKSRKDATTEIQQKYGYQSFDSTLKSLFTFRENVIKMWKKTYTTRNMKETDMIPKCFCRLSKMSLRQ